MNILHYSLGLYPDRQGGLVRYSTALAEEQAKEYKVYYLMPGKLGIIDKKVEIKKGGTHKGIEVYKIDNALPIPLFAGIKDIGLYTRKVNGDVYRRFLSEQAIDYVHIHSLMGLHRELLQSAKELNIPIFMTTHDFFGLCPTTNLYRDGTVCDNKCIDQRCFDCSQFAHGYYKLAVGQSSIYRKLKNTAFIGNLRKDALADTSSDAKEVSTEGAPDYKYLDEYYKECFSLIDYYLFNSNQTKEVFEERLGALPGDVIPLLLPTIKDNRKKRQFMTDGIFHIGYMGECKNFKGYFLLEKVVKELVSEGYKIELDVFNESAIESRAIVKKGKYTASQLDNIYDSLDLIAVPSIWYETLSFIAIEAIAAGMPCLVSDHVGAKDYIRDGETGFVVKAGDKDAVIDCLRSRINKEKLCEINAKIIEEPLAFNFSKHCRAIQKRYNTRNIEA